MEPLVNILYPTLSRETVRKYCLHVVSSVYIALAASGHLGVNMVDRGRVGQRRLCVCVCVWGGQIDSENARILLTDDRKGR